MRSNTKVLVPLAVLITILALPSSTLLPSAFATPSVWYVAPTPTLVTVHSGGSCFAPGANTISAAIAAASPGDTIKVCPGTYTEQVTIGESLTVQSTGGPWKTIIQAPNPMTTTFVSATDTYGEDNIVTITGATTTAVLSGFNITGTKGNFFLDSVTDVNICDNGPGGGTGTLGLGVFVEQGATATITNNIITHIHNYPYYPCAAYGIGIWVGRGGEASTPGTATISGNTIYDYQKSAIIVDGTESTATITGNTITGWSLAFQASVPGGIAQNGIQISRGAVATITSNTISVNECNSVLATSCGPGLEQDYASGIILYSSGPGTVVSKNTLSANDIGIVLVEADPSTTVSLNMLSANRYEGIYVNDGTNTVSGNMITGPGNVGIASVADSVNTVVTATGNHVTSTVTTPYEAFGESGYTASILISQLP